MVNKKEIKHQIKWVLFWIILAMIFNLGLLYFEGKKIALEFAAGYLIELSLSIDNLFVFLMIFRAYDIQGHAQHRVLNYGIFGAIILRLIFICFGLALVKRIEWILYLFGVILLYSGFKMAFEKEKQKNPKDSKIIKVINKILPMSDHYDGEKFLTKENGKKVFTPLFAVLCLIEGSDIIFAIDSIPAVFSVSTHVLVVYFSNIFAILGLRQLYFVLQDLHERFKMVKYGVAIILAFTGAKLLLLIFGIHVPTALSICIIFAVILLSVIVSWQMDKSNSKIS